MTFLEEIDNSRKLLRLLIGEKADSLTPWQIMCEMAALQVTQNAESLEQPCLIKGIF